MLSLEHYYKKYSKNKFYSAKDITFSVEAGTVCGLVGSNGAGKSTIIKSLTGVLPFGEGKITICGFDIVKDPENAKRHVGYVPDDHSVYEKLTGREYINYMGSLFGATKEQKERTATELADYFEITNALDRQIATYSHGMRQKICLLGSLVHNPDLWVLDEPMVGLDPQTMAKLQKFIKNYADNSHAVLFSSHNLDTVKKVCDEVVFIKQGELVDSVDIKNNKGFDLEKRFMEINEVKIDA